MSDALDIQQTPRGLVLPVRAHAAAKRTCLAGVQQGMLKVSVTQQPERGKANQAIVELLAKRLGISKSNIHLLSGATSPKKRFLISGVDCDTLQGLAAGPA